jgi:hypothetical protein
MKRPHTSAVRKSGGTATSCSLVPVKWRLKAGGREEQAGRVGGWGHGVDRQRAIKRKPVSSDSHSFHHAAPAPVRRRLPAFSALFSPAVTAQAPRPPHRRPRPHCSPLTW